MHFLNTVAVVVFLLGPAASCAGGSSSYFKDSKSIVGEVSKRNAGAVVSELYSRPDEWNFVLRQIASGDESWLKAAVALQPAADGGSANMLKHSVGEALETSPNNVFKIALSTFDLKAICSGPDIDDSQFNSFDLAMGAINRRQRSVSKISDPMLSNASKACMQSLEQAKSEIARFYKKN